MVTYQIMYWEDIPSQVRVEADADEVKAELSERFQEKIDRVATERGVTGSDAYLDGWKWGDLQERAGSAQEVLDAIVKELEDGFEE